MGSVLRGRSARCDDRNRRALRHESKPRREPPGTHPDHRIGVFVEHRGAGDRRPRSCRHRQRPSERRWRNPKPRAARRTRSVAVGGLARRADRRRLAARQPRWCRAVHGRHSRRRRAHRRATPGARIQHRARRRTARSGSDLMSNKPDIAATRQLAEFVAGLCYERIPEHVIEKTKDLMVDWLGSALAGKGARPVVALERFAATMGPATGPAEIIPSGATTSALFAAMINGASSHVAEQDDVHNGSVFHPAAVVFPAVLAAAQTEGASGRDVLVAVVAGYEVGIRVGEFLGRSHYKIFHTTGTAGTLAAAAAAGNLLALDAQQMRHAFGSAGTQSAGLWEFLRTAADSKQLHTAHAAGAGLFAAWLA